MSSEGSDAGGPPAGGAPEVPPEVPIPEEQGEGPKPFRYARHVFLGVSGAALVAIIVVARGVLLPFLLAALVGYVFFPLVKVVERTRVPRWLAILLVYAVTLGAMGGFGYVVVPRLFEETKALSTELPKATQRVRDEWLPAVDARLKRWADTGPPPTEEELAAQEREPGQLIIKPRGDGTYEVRMDRNVVIRKRGDDTWVIGPPREERESFSSERALRNAFDRAIAFARTNSLELLALGRAIVAGVSRGIFFFFITLMLAGYMMFTYERIHGFLRDMWPDYRRKAFDRFVYRLDRAMAGVVRGQLLICLVNGVLSAIGFWIFDLKYWPILSLVAAAMSIIPIFGSILSSIPAVAIGLTQSFGTAVGVLVWIIAIHQLEANFLNPKIIGDQAKIHPVLVVFALLLGEHLYSITGALLAVPCLAIVQAVFMHFRESVLGLPALRISRTSLMPAGVRAPHMPSSQADTPLIDTKRSAIPPQGTASDQEPPTGPPEPDPVESEPPPPKPEKASDKRPKPAVSTTLKSETE